MSETELTITVAIGNSDNRLSQADWHKYWKEIDEYFLCTAGIRMHQRAVTLSTDPYQSACWIFEISRVDRLLGHDIREHLINIRKRYEQDSIAWVEGTSCLI